MKRCTFEQLLFFIFAKRKTPPKLEKRFAMMDGDGATNERMVQIWLKHVIFMS